MNQHFQRKHLCLERRNNIVLSQNNNSTEKKSIQMRLPIDFREQKKLVQDTRLGIHVLEVHDILLKVERVRFESLVILGEFEMSIEAKEKTFFYEMLMTKKKKKRKRKKS
eukprot:CAMPEP_0201491256 /NCGR_PEP_ID=MMETSP0151_2-20130828/29144_1 /ASSEMBLY_ACC=CAM_ASM_000257 /TAXON_ID=200890 /ORGANISM="Paramoeba atlantica, Strain 621/1 / CCAP 1560/9" /LENGTH=109 /DNA_ID=CAMNT_0047877529 /DNA_START=184 /DNA_END=509 /DNA_ORIENTATION=-